MLNDAAKGLGSDCKHYAVFSGSVLQELKVPFTYRLAGYVNNTPQHIYCVIKDGQREIPLDAVVGYYNYEKKPKALYDMALYKLSGTDSDFPGFDGLGREYQRMGIETDQLGKIDIKKSVQKVVQGTKTLGLAVPRNAFIVLVKFNAFGFATKIKKLIDAKGFDGISFWQQLGGNRTDLTNAANEGAKKKAVLGYTAKSDYMLSDGFGEPVTIATALASAAPIIIKFKDVLKAAGITDADIAAAASKATDNFKKTTGSTLNKVIFKAEIGVQGSGSKITASNLQEPTEKEAERVVKTTLVNSTGIENLPDPNIKPESAGFVGLPEMIRKNPLLAVAGAFLIYKLIK